MGVEDIVVLSYKPHVSSHVCYVISKVSNLRTSPKKLHAPGIRRYPLTYAVIAAVLINPFNLSRGSWGAYEVGAKFANLQRRSHSEEALLEVLFGVAGRSGPFIHVKLTGTDICQAVRKVKNLY